mmetsp:Transcript_3893/g.9813  ORF Transcript_3893/g.9813 Transcript_3893/m.9813 type:complete len:275 (-) Transcript_3893:23-847(-)
MADGAAGAAVDDRAAAAAMSTPAMVSTLTDPAYRADLLRLWATTPPHGGGDAGSGADLAEGDKSSIDSIDPHHALGTSGRVRILEANDSLRHILTTLLAANTQHGDMLFFFRRLLKLVIHSAVDVLQYVPRSVQSPHGRTFDGLKLADEVCAVTVIRGGVHLAQSTLREALQRVSIGHILIADNAVVYAKLARPLYNSKILLVDFQIVTGAALIKAIEVLLDHGAAAQNITLVAPMAYEAGVLQIRKVFPYVSICTAVVHKVWTADFDTSRLES